MKNCIANLNKDNNGGHGQNALDLLPSKKSKWIIETPGFFRNQKQRIVAESVTINPNGALSVIIDKAQNRCICFAGGRWISFYTDDTKHLGEI